MATTSNGRVAPEADGQEFVIPGVSWDAYVAFNDALGERSFPRMIYCDRTTDLYGKNQEP